MLTIENIALQLEINIYLEFNSFNSFTIKLLSSQFVVQMCNKKGPISCDITQNLWFSKQLLFSGYVLILSSPWLQTTVPGLTCL